MKTRTQKLKIGGHDTQFAFFGLSRFTDKAYDVTSTNFCHVFKKSIFSGLKFGKIT